MPARSSRQRVEGPRGHLEKVLIKFEWLCDNPMGDRHELDTGWRDGGRLKQVASVFGRQNTWSRSRWTGGRLEEDKYIEKTQGSQWEVVVMAGGRFEEVVVLAGLTVVWKQLWLTPFPL